MPCQACYGTISPLRTEYLRYGRDGVPVRKTCQDERRGYGHVERHVPGLRYAPGAVRAGRDNSLLDHSRIFLSLTKVLILKLVPRRER